MFTAFPTLEEASTFLECWLGAESWNIIPSQLLLGTISVSGNTVIGTTTTFTVDFAVGDYVFSSYQGFVVSSITNDTEMILDRIANPDIANGAYAKLTEAEILQFKRQENALTTGYYSIINAKNYNIPEIIPPIDDNLKKANSVLANRLFIGQTNSHQADIEAGIKSKTLGRKSVTYKDSVIAIFPENVHMFLCDYYVPMPPMKVENFKWPEEAKSSYYNTPSPYPYGSDWGGKYGRC